MQYYADIPWLLATGGQKGELAIWDTEEDQRVVRQFKDKMPEKARQLKKKADRGYEKDADMADGGDSSGFEDCSDSDDNEDTNTQEMAVEETSSKKKAKKATKK